MCGIIGYFSKFSCSGIEQVKDAQKKLNHRGPDDRGIVRLNIDSNDSSGTLILGHTRLSIIDLSKGGHQPKFSQNGRYVITYNGEIYNYLELRSELESSGCKFLTQTDTEVLLVAWERWGIECLAKIKGMFAFVVFDKKEQMIHCVRDGFGIKPFFYFYNNHEFKFSSEIQGLIPLLSSKPEPNWDTALKYLALGEVDKGENTFYQGIKHLPPGHYLKLSLAPKTKLILSRWWNPSVEENGKISFAEASKTIREKFLSNVKLHLRSDVSVGAALSGGIDSSAIVCAIRHLEPKIPISTFSFISSEASKNEEKWIDIVNLHVGAIPHKIVIKPSELIEDLEELISLQGEPFGSTSIYAQYRVFQKLRQQDITVSLDGQGADELLAGYHGYPFSKFKSLLSELKIKKFLKLFLGIKNRTGNYPLKDLIKIINSPSVQSLFAHYRKIVSRKSLLNEKFVKKLPITHSYMEETDNENSRFLSLCLRDALMGKNGLVHLLRYEDRNSMIHSVESRVPFLTTDIAEYILSLPEDFLLAADGTTKCIFRDAMKGIVPQEILQRKDKVGFETPELDWLRSERNRINGWIQNFHKVPILDRKKSSIYFQKICERKVINSSKLWRMINYYKWYEINYLN